jgi:trigger factor
VGAGSDVEGLDDQLRGSKTGDILQFEAKIPGPGGEPAGATFRVLVKEVKEKNLPAATDAWAAEASEFETLDELRADLRSRITQVKLVQAQLALRDRAVEALVGLVEDEPPDALVDAELRERLHDLGHRLEERGMTFEQFLAASGRTEGDLLEEIRAEAAHAVRVDLALRALVEAEGIDVTDDELDATLGDMAEQAGTTAADLRARLDRAGRLPAVRSDQRKAKALTWLLDNVELVDENGAPVSRDELRAVAGGPEEQSSVGTPGPSPAEASPEAPAAGTDSTSVEAER